MATHDYIISNASGAAVRADLNNALAAIATNNSSATEPTTTYAYQWWADTGSSPTVMKLRNAANSGWVTLFQLDGEWSLIPFENGTAAAPSIYFKDSGTDTGLFSPGVDQVGITTGGAVRLTTSTTAVTSTLPVVYPLGAVGTPSVTFTGDLNTGIYSPGADSVAITTGGTARATVDSSGRLLVGATTARGIGTSINFSTQIEGVASGTTYPGLSITNNSNDQESPYISFGKSRGTAVGSNTAVQINDVVGRIIFAAADGTDLESRVATIEALIDATPGANDTPGRLVFSTTADGASAVTERCRIDSSGRLLVGATSTSANTTALLQGFGGTSTGAAHLRLARGSNTPLSGDNLGLVIFSDSEHTNCAFISADRDGGTWSASSKPSRLVFSTTADGASSPTERMRISNNGNVGIRHANNASIVDISSDATSGYTDRLLGLLFPGYTPNNTTARFLYCADNALVRAEIRSNGGLANYQANNVNLSDRNAKKDISPAADTWDCIKEWEIVNYRYKDQPDDADLNLGVIAQQVAESCPEVITVFQEAKEAKPAVFDDDGNEVEPEQKAQPEKLGVKEQQMYWMAIKALQEAQARIETLEAKVAALEAN